GQRAERALDQPRAPVSWHAAPVVTLTRGAQPRSPRFPPRPPLFGRTLRLYGWRSRGRSGSRGGESGRLSRREWLGRLIPFEVGEQLMDASHLLGQALGLGFVCVACLP